MHPTVKGISRWLITKAAAKANAALISMSNHHDDISVEMKTQVAFGGDDIFGLEQANVQGHFAEPNPIPTKPRFPVHLIIKVLRQKIMYLPPKLY